MATHQNAQCVRKYQFQKKCVGRDSEQLLYALYGTWHAVAFAGEGVSQAGLVRRKGDNSDVTGSEHEHNHSTDELRYPPFATAVDT